ncbi:MAG: hypothetical protein M3M85_04420 [bacterium]|nr:hypothetical protein [bacterium]
MTKISTHNQSLLFLLILTVLGSIVAYQLTVNAYDSLLANSALGSELTQ